MTLDAIRHPRVPLPIDVPHGRIPLAHRAMPCRAGEPEATGAPVPRRARATIWGDGFAEDGWSELYSVDSWDGVGEDEYARLFPHLVPRDGSVPAAIVRRLADHVGVRAWRLRHLDPLPDEAPLTSMTRKAAEAIGAARRHAVALRPGWLPAAMVIGRRGASRAAARDRAELAALDEVLGRAMRGDLAPVGAGQMLAFAFLTAIHPAYLWPAAAVTHERGAAAGWLGIVAGGRPAQMTAEVADYFADAIQRRGGHHRFGDAAMAGLAADNVAPATLAAAAARRRDGRLVVVRRSIVAGWLARTAAARGQDAAILRSIRQA